MEIENNYCEFNKYIAKSKKLDDKSLNLSEFFKEISNKIEKMKQILVIDRFEGNYAICENGETKEIVEIKKDILPENAKEGSVLKWQNGKYKIDIEEQKNIEKRIKEKMDNLWE